MVAAVKVGILFLCFLSVSSSRLPCQKSTYFVIHTKVFPTYIMIFLEWVSFPWSSNSDDITQTQHCKSNAIELNFNWIQSNSIELNPWIEFDWVRQSNEIEHTKNCTIEFNWTFDFRTHVFCNWCWKSIHVTSSWRLELLRNSRECSTCFS